MKKTSYKYRYEVRQNPLNGKCKIIKFKYRTDTGRTISYGTIYKNLPLATAEEYKYSLERGEQPT